MTDDDDNDSGDN